MGVYQYDDPITGKGYDFTISGDVPSDTEFARISQQVKKDRASYQQRVQEFTGEEFEIDDETAVRRGLRRGYQQIKQAIGETVGTIGEQKDIDFLEDFGLGMEEKARQRLGELAIEQPDRMQSTDVDSIDSALTYAGEVVGEQIPQLGLGLSAAVLGTAAAPAIPFAGAVTGIAAAGAATAPILFGNNIQRQEDEVSAGKKTKVDVDAALKATYGQAALEGIADKILLGGLLRPLGKSIFTRTLSRATGGATTEGLTEVGQQILERSQAGLPIDSEDAIAEYREAAIAGGLIGGGTRATFGAFQGTPGEDGVTTDTEITPPVATEVDAAAEKKAKANADKKAAEDAAAELKVKTDAQKKEEANAVDPTPPKGKAEQTEAERAAATAFVATDTDKKAAIEREEENKLKAAENKAQEIIDKSKAQNVETPAEFVRRSEDRAAAIKSEQTGEQIEVKKQETVVETTEDTIDDEFLAGLNVPKEALIRREKGKKSLIGKNKSDPETIQALRDYVNVSSIPEAREGVQSYLDTLEVADAGIDTAGTRTSVESGEQSVAGGTGVRTGVESTEDVTPSDDARLGGDLQPTDRTAVPTAEQSDALTEKEVFDREMAEIRARNKSMLDGIDEITAEEEARIAALADRSTATPVQAELFSDLPEDTRGVVRDTQGPRINVPSREFQTTLPLQEEGAGPRGLNVPPSPTGVPTAGQTTGAAGQVIPEGVQVATPNIVGASVPQEQLQAAEAQRLQAAQARIDRIFDNNRGKQPQRREYHNTQIDPRVSPDIGTALDKEAVADLVETSDENLKGMDNAIAARIFFKRFRRPVDAVAEIGSVLANGPTQQAIETDVVAGGKTKKKSKKDEEAEKGRFFYTPEEFVYYEGMTQQNAAKAAEWVDENMSQALSNELSAAYDLTARDTSAFGARADNYIKMDRAIKSIGKDEAKQEEDLAAKDTKDYIESVKEEVDQEAKPVTLVPYPWAELNNKKLLINPIHGLDQALLPSIRNALQRGDLKFALEAIASTSNVRNVRRVASGLIDVVGDTRVQVVPDLSQRVGRTAAGLFSPETNTIFIDANRGMNVHTVLHEMAHAATSAALAQPSLPETKQLQQIFNTVREQIGEVYGTQNLDEFVAESMSNPEFRSALALTRMGDTSAFRKFVEAVKRRIRKILNMPPSSKTLTEVDSIIEGMLAPSPATRAAPDILLAAGTKKGSNNLLQSIANLAPDSVKDKADVVLNEGVARTAKGWTLNTLPVNILTDIASERIPFAKELNTIINQQSGALRQKSEATDSILYNLHKWQRKNPKRSKILNNIIPRSTFLKIDPSRGNDAKYMKTIRDSRERSAEFDTLQAEYNKLDKAGKDFYRQMRNYFQGTYDDIISALDARLEATIPDKAAKEAAFEKLRKLLQADTGVIRPYFPLQRKGNYRLAYSAPDPDTGQNEFFVEYFPTLRKVEQARDSIISIDPNAEITEVGRSTVNFDNAPSASFVRNMLETVNLRRDSFAATPEGQKAFDETMQALVDLSLDAMPERSFMQNFRRRKGVRGFIGDVTPTGAGSMDFDAYTMLKEKGRDLNRQLVQLNSAAKIENFRKKLTPYRADPTTAMMADKIDQIAKFAQSPNVPRASQILNSVGFAYTMGLNFSSAAITFFDVAMSAMPVLAGKYGIIDTSGAFGTASKLFMGAPTTRTIMVTGPDGQPVPQEVNMGVAGKSISNYDLNSLPKKLRDLRADVLIRMGIDQGQFNQSMTQENLEIGRDAPLETFNRFSSFMFHHSERFNRETTLVSAYTLKVKQLQKSGRELTDADYESAAQEAINDTEFTLGATAAAGRPIVAQKGLGNVVFLFKRFAISKYYMMYRLATEAAKGDKAALAGGRNFLIMTGALAGLGGMPLMGAFGAIYDLFTGDDEDDFETELRLLVDEGIYGGLANEILGIDVANRISMNSLLYRKPIVEKDQSSLWTLIEQLGGPVLGVTLSIERGIKDVADGEVYRGIESMVPAAFRNGMKTFRFATEGATTRRGDPITEDINAYNIAMQGLGFAPQAYIQALEANKNTRRRENAIDSKRSKLLRRRNMAIREGDRDELAKVEALIREFNQNLPRDADIRKKLITSDTKKSSLRSFERRTKNTMGGITTTDFSRSILNRYDFD